MPQKFAQTRKDGERKFSMNQNLTVLFVLRRTLKIMMDTNLWRKDSHWCSVRLEKEDLLPTSYRSPEATVNMLISAWPGLRGITSALFDF
jgi:hypothetical protein